MFEYDLALCPSGFGTLVLHCRSSQAATASIDPGSWCQINLTWSWMKNKYKQKQTNKHKQIQKQRHLLTRVAGVKSTQQSPGLERKIQKQIKTITQKYKQIYKQLHQLTRAAIVKSAQQSPDLERKIQKYKQTQAKKMKIDSSRCCQSWRNRLNFRVASFWGNAWYWNQWSLP